MSELASWTARAADADPAIAAAVWADPAAPPDVLRRPSAAVLEFLVGDGLWTGALIGALHHPALTTTVLAALAERAKGEARATIAEFVLYDRVDVPLLLAAAPALTPARLAKAVIGLRFGYAYQRDPDAAAARLAKILRGFVTSSTTRCRALAAEAFPLTVGPRHRYAEGEVSATRLVTDPATAVVVGLARNYHLRTLPENDEGLAVRRALLGSEHARVRTAARRSGVHVLDSHVVAALSAADGRPAPAPAHPAGVEQADPLDDPAPAVRVTAIRGGIHQHDGARWARVLADPSPQVRKAAATHGYFTPSFVWTALAGDPEPSVRKAVASSRWAPAELQRRLLSDANPTVAGAADAADPLARPVQVRPTLPADGEIMLPVSYSHDPRIRLLDYTAVTLTLDQQRRLAQAARTGAAHRAAARDRVIRRLGNSTVAGWVADRWERWCDVFALPAPRLSQIGLAGKLAEPFTGAEPADDRVSGALALFDAVLGVAAAPPDTDLADSADLPDVGATLSAAQPQDPADLAALTQPWEQVLLPTVVSAETVYGPRTPAARRLLTTAARLPRSRVDSVLTTRIALDDQQWRTARGEAVETAAGPNEQLYAAHFLFWDCVAAAELATWQRPTDPLLVDALWGAAAVTLYGEHLAPETARTLVLPCAAAGLAIPD
jgi:hypothetical protein